MRKSTIPRSGARSTVGKQLLPQAGRDQSADSGNGRRGMPVILRVRDETTSGDVYDERPLEFPTERITVRELIRERVYQEVQDFNRKSREQTFRGLVQPTDAERTLNGKP